MSEALVNGRKFAESCGCVVQARGPKGKDLSLGRAIFGCMRGKFGQGAGKFGACNNAFAFQYCGQKSQPVTMCLHQRFDLKHSRTISGETL